MGFAPSAPSLGAGNCSIAGSGARARSVPVPGSHGSCRRRPACGWHVQAVRCTCCACSLPAAARRGVSCAWRSSAASALAPARSFPVDAWQSLPPTAAGFGAAVRRLSGGAARAAPQHSSTAQALDSVPISSANGVLPRAGQPEAGLEGAQLLGGEQGQGAAGRSDSLHLATLMVQCADRKGVIAALAQLLYGLGCNIIASDQYVDPEARRLICMLTCM